MATRKKKSEVTEEMLTPTIVVGSHLTVTTWPDGRTDLMWDDDALLRDVRAAILKYESNVPVLEESSVKKKTTKPKKVKE